MKVLISDPLSEVGIRIFKETPGIEVDVNTGLSPEQLGDIIAPYEGLVIRSATVRKNCQAVYTALASSANQRPKVGVR